MVQYVKTTVLRISSSSYFPVSGPNTEKYGIQSELGRIRTAKNSEYGRFSRSLIPAICPFLQSLLIGDFSKISFHFHWK